MACSEAKSLMTMGCTYRKYLLVCIVLIVALFLPVSESWSAYRTDVAGGPSVIYVIDGDSLKVEMNGDIVEVRLWGIDAPEYDQPGSTGAKNQLMSLVTGCKIEITIKDRDRYGRSVAVVQCTDVKVNEEMVRSGNAWVHPYYCREIVCKKWKRLESEARKNNLGLWRWDDPIPPWKWKLNKR